MTTWVTIPTPNSSLLQLSPVSINDSDVIVGNAPVIGAIGENNGFIYQSGTTTILADGAGYSVSTPTAINNKGEIVGGVQVSAASFSESATIWNNGSPTLLAAPIVGASTNALAINDGGDVAGFSSTTPGQNTAVVWLGSGAPAILANLVDSTRAIATGINNADQVVGYAYTASGFTHAVLWSSPTSAATDLVTPAGYQEAEAAGINSNGEVIGNAYNGGNSTAFTWQNGSYSILPLITGFSYSVALDINEEGQAVGYVNAGSTFHAVLWQNGQAVDLNSLLTLGGVGVVLEANGINDYGQIAASANGKALLITPSTLPNTITMPTLNSASPNALLVDLAYAPFNPSSMTISLNGSTLSVMEGTANLGSATLSNAAGLTAANFYVAEDANGGTEIHVTSSAAAAANFSITDTTLNTKTASPGIAYSGPVSGLDYQYLSTGSDSVNVTANVDNVFLHGGTGGGNALAAFGGINVLDGGAGSNFLVGVAATAAPIGRDTFFVDGRGTAAVWSTVVHFHQGDAATLWGVTSTTPLQTIAEAGAAGYQGFTIHADTLGNGSYSSSITLAGVTQAQVHETFGTVGGTPYLYLTVA